VVSEEAQTDETPEEKRKLTPQEALEGKVRKSKRGVGRPSKLTEELVVDVCKLVMAGVPITLAFDSCDVPRSTYFDWKKRAEADDPKVVWAFNAIRSAQATIISHLANRRIKLALKSESVDAIYKVMHTLDRESFPLEAGPGISVTQNVKNTAQTLVVGAGYDSESRGAQQLTKKGAEAMREGFLLQGKTRDEVYETLAEHGVIVGSVDGSSKKKDAGAGGEETAQVVDTEGESA
jgi:hypothetical protein